MEKVQEAFDKLNAKIKSTSDSGATGERVAELKALAADVEAAIKEAVEE